MAGLLRICTAGSVDDGKSTLIGRLLYDSKMIYEDTLAKLEKDSAVHGTTGGGFDPAMLTDGLKEEKEQGEGHDKEAEQTAGKSGGAGKRPS